MAAPALLIRKHETAGTRSEVRFSHCGSYRYFLSRCWGSGPLWTFVMLNPSTADELRNDATVARCENRARASGCGEYRVVNLYGFCATRPRALFQSADPVGPGNDATILDACEAAEKVILAWGTLARSQRAAEVEALLEGAGHRLWQLGLCKNGAPRHPLYLSSSATPSLRRSR